MASTITVPELIASLESPPERRQLYALILDALRNPRTRAMEAPELAAAVGARMVGLAVELLRLERSGLVIHGKEDGIERYALSGRGARLMETITRLHIARTGTA